MKKFAPYIAVSIALTSVYAVVAAQAQWMENGQECHFDVNEVTVCAPSPTQTPPSSGAPPNGSTAPVGSGGGGGGGGGGSDGGGGGSGFATPEEFLRYLEQNAPDPHMGYPMMGWVRHLNLTAVIYCERSTNSLFAGWRIAVALSAEEAMRFQSECAVAHGIPTILWAN